MLELVSNNLVLDDETERTAVNLYQVTVYKIREDKEARQTSSGNSKLTQSRESDGGSSSCPKDNF